MRVKYLRGNRNTEYTVVMPEDRSISDLSSPIQEAIEGVSVTSKR